MLLEREGWINFHDSACRGSTKEKKKKGRPHNNGEPNYGIRCRAASQKQSAAGAKRCECLAPPPASSLRDKHAGRRIRFSPGFVLSSFVLFLSSIPVLEPVGAYLSSRPLVAR